MKRIILATSLILAAGTASAMVSPTDLSSHVSFQVRALVPNADLNELTTAQVAAIETIFTSSDNRGAGDNVRGQIKKILNWN